jgi:hypothetical protein
MEANFEVVVEGGSTSLEDFHRRKEVPVAELPDLTDGERDFARKFGIPEEDYRRSSWATLEGDRRIRSRSEKLGAVVEEDLKALGDDYSLARIIAQPFEERWILVVRTPRGPKRVSIEREFGDDLLDSGHYREALRHQLERELKLGQKAS